MTGYIFILNAKSGTRVLVRVLLGIVVPCLDNILASPAAKAVHGRDTWVRVSASAVEVVRLGYRGQTRSCFRPPVFPAFLSTAVFLTRNKIHFDVL